MNRVLAGVEPATWALFEHPRGCAFRPGGPLAFQIAARHAKWQESRDSNSAGMVLEAFLYPVRLLQVVCSPGIEPGSYYYFGHGSRPCAATNYAMSTKMVRISGIEPEPPEGYVSETYAATSYAISAKKLLKLLKWWSISESNRDPIGWVPKTHVSASSTNGP